MYCFILFFEVRKIYYLVNKFLTMNRITAFIFVFLLHVQCTTFSQAEAITSKVSGAQLTPKGIPLIIGKNNFSVFELKIYCMDDHKTKDDNQD